jgi:hypothetical protein
MLWERRLLSEGLGRSVVYAGIVRHVEGIGLFLLRAMGGGCGSRWRVRSRRSEVFGPLFGNFYMAS